MAAEVIALLHSLLTAPESNTAQIWTSTAEKVTIIYMTLSQRLCFLEGMNFTEINPGLSIKFTIMKFVLSQLIAASIKYNVVFVLISIGSLPSPDVHPSDWEVC